MSRNGLLVAGRGAGGGIENNTWHRPGDMASEEAGEFECCSR